MNNIVFDLSRFTTKMARGSQRGLILEEILKEVNEERIGTKYKPMTIRHLAVKLSHLKEISDLTYLTSICKSYKARGGQYGRCFWGAIKIKT